ncbi:MAG: acetoin utilization protein AcuC [Nitrososphaerales archaeon]
MGDIGIYYGEELLQYAFPNGHKFNKERVKSFWEAVQILGLLERREVRVLKPALASTDILELFHTKEHIEFVKKMSEVGSGLLDYGDTPAFKGVFEAASYVVGSVVDAVDRVMLGEVEHCFIPVAGLHHARRDRAAGFCVFNDIGVAIVYAKKKYGLNRILYVDIDAHHGDGVFYEFYDDPMVWIADIHEDGRYLYPGTGFREETGSPHAPNTKLNIPLPPGATDREFIEAFKEVEEFARRAEPQLIFFQCGADGLEGDPITHLRYTYRAHRHAAERLHEVAHILCKGRIIATGGGGYNENNTAAAWNAVLMGFLGPRWDMPTSPGYML